MGDLVRMARGEGSRDNIERVSITWDGADVYVRSISKYHQSQRGGSAKSDTTYEEMERDSDDSPYYFEAYP